MNKDIARKRRARKVKAVIHGSKSNRPRLVVHRSGTHIYSQIVQVGENGDLVIASASTLDRELKGTLSGNKVQQAAAVGKLIAKRAQEKNIIDVAFDRAGYKYHGRVKALAEAAREGGMNF